MTVLLAFDSSVGPCSVAVWRDGVVAYRLEMAQVMQARGLVPMIEAALGEAGIWYDGLDGIATTLGPGSFTGIRVALATARAFHLASQIPLIGATTLEVLAWGALEKAKGAGVAQVLACLNAGRGQVYAQLFKLDGGLVAVTEPAMVDPAELAGMVSGTCVVAGNVSEVVGAHVKAVVADVTYPDAKFLVELVANRPATALSGMRPLYIRPPDAKLPAAV